MSDPPPDVEELVRDLHGASPRAVFAFAGAGVRALAWLHAVGGSSRTVLEARDLYHPASLADALGAAPATAVDPHVADDLALACLTRARWLTREEGAPGPLVGLAATATIATDRPKRGEHRAFVAAADAFGVGRYGVEFRKGARDRSAEEDLVSRLSLTAAADASGLLHAGPPALRADERLERELSPSPPVAAFLADDAGMLAFDKAGRVEATDTEREGPLALVSGNFRPLHDGHLALAEAAARHLGREVRFELPLRNADKADVGPWEARRRAAQFFGHAPLLLTRAPRFVDKAERLPGSVFVVGVDTAARVLDERFYAEAGGMRAALARVREAGGRFLVAGRDVGAGFRTQADLSIPPDLADLFEPLPEFRVDRSSTEIRAGWTA